MTANRKLYEALSAKFRAARPDNEDMYPVWRHSCWLVAQAIWEQGAGFNRLKFVQACGWTEADVARYGHLF